MSPASTLIEIESPPQQYPRVEQSRDNAKQVWGGTSRTKHNSWPSALESAGGVPEVLNRNKAAWSKSYAQKRPERGLRTTLEMA